MFKQNCHRCFRRHFEHRSRRFSRKSGLKHPKIAFLDIFEKLSAKHWRTRTNRYCQKLTIDFCSLKWAQWQIDCINPSNKGWFLKIKQMYLKIVTDYRSSFRSKKFKMADSIWRSRFIKINHIYLIAILNSCSARKMPLETPGAILFATPMQGCVIRVPW